MIARLTSTLLTILSIVPFTAPFASVDPVHFLDSHDRGRSVAIVQVATAPADNQLAVAATTGQDRYPPVHTPGSFVLALPRLFVSARPGGLLSHPPPQSLASHSTTLRI